MTKKDLIAAGPGHLYETYSKAVGGKSFDGKPLPSWEEFSNDPSKQTQVLAWMEVYKEAIGV